MSNWRPACVGWRRIEQIFTQRVQPSPAEFASSAAMETSGSLFIFLCMRADPEKTPERPFSKNTLYANRKPSLGSSYLFEEQFKIML